MLASFLIAYSEEKFFRSPYTTVFTDVTLFLLQMLRRLTSKAIWAWSILLWKIFNYKFNLFNRSRAIKVIYFFLYRH